MPATEPMDLSPEAEQRIAEVVRSLAEDRVDRGVDISRPMRCDSCQMEKSPLGSSQYGAYALCNDCLLEFTLCLARGDVENVAEYMTKRPEEYGLPHDPPDTSSLETRAAHQSSLPKRTDKLMPSNEPC